jgi:amphi-Trp domain-containing protein
VQRLTQSTLVKISASDPPAPWRAGRDPDPQLHAKKNSRHRGRAPLRATTVIASAAFVEKINTKEVSVDLMEITEKERLSREQAAARLHALADALARHNEVEFERGGLRFTVHVPDEVDFKLEIEIGEDERELEVEITW